MPSKLVLVRHSTPEIVQGVPASGWRLSADGKIAAAALAPRLRPFNASAIWSSPEPKALETAEIVAEALDLPIRPTPDLREHDRTSLGFIDKATLEAGVERLLRSDDDLVFGDETARSVFARMERALLRGDGENLLAVTHGTAAAIFVSRISGIDSVEFWRSLRTPAAIVLSGDRLEQVLQ
jgi:broad specificity phosphatase PhoE